MTGLLLVILSVSMTIPAIADAAEGGMVWPQFLISAAASLFVGMSLVLGSRSRQFAIGVKEAFVLTTLSWIVIAAFASLPILLSMPEIGISGAFFEAMSGLTTTGSTVIANLDETARGILLWRALLQWLGGIGIIVMAIAVLPLLGVGGMQLFRIEMSDHSKKLLPRAGPTAAWITMTYGALTLIWAAALWAAGMSPFEAICHAMTTIATGGFSTADGSIGAFNSSVIDWIIVTGMLVGSLPFLLYVQAVRGDPLALLRDSQVRYFLALCLISAVLMTAWIFFRLDAPVSTALRYAAFSTTSIVTGTGFTTTHFDNWGTFPVTLLFFLMFVGGCTGSTTGGIKIFRFQVLFNSIRTELSHFVRPHMISAPRFNGEPVPDPIIRAVRAFFFVFILSFACTALLLGLHGYDFVTSTSAAATAISNVGPGLGPLIGPANNYGPMENSAKWVLSAAMLLGRLELFTVLLLFLPRFWRT